MNSVSGNCVLSFGLLGSDAPEHIITAIEIIDTEHLVTGDKIGNIVVWKVYVGDNISVQWLLMGHSGAISSLTKISRSNKYFVSTSKTKEIALWNCDDGRCVKFVRNVQLDHRFVLSHSSIGNFDLLFCCGHYPGIHLLDTLSLHKRATLVSHAHPNWIISLCVFEHPQAFVHVVLGLSIAGAVTMWTLELLKDPSTTVIYETESKLLQIKNPLCISICPDKPRLVLILSDTYAQIYDAATWTLLCESDNSSGFVSGHFINQKIVLIKLYSGESYFYRLPITVDGMKQLTDGKIKSLVRASMLNKPCTDSSCQSIIREKDELIVITGSMSGILNKYTIPMSELTTSDIKCQTFTFKLHDKWSEKNMLSITENLSPKVQVTCLHSVPTVGLLFIGLINGDISIAKFINSICASLFFKDFSSVSEFVLNGHTSKVSTLRYAETKAYSGRQVATQWLWSGSADFSVRLWDLTSRKCIKIFHCHSGFVRDILESPILGLTRSKHEGHIRARKMNEDEHEVLRPINGESWIGTRLYVSLDDDCGMAFLSLEMQRVVLRVNFNSQILSIGWRCDQVIAVISTVDGYVYVWELESGIIDRREYGQLGEDILDNCHTINRHNSCSFFPPIAQSINERSKRISGAAVSLYNLPFESKSSTYIVLCDTEALLVDLYRDQSSEREKSLIEAQLLLCLINIWGLDLCLDATLKSTIGLLPPTKRICRAFANMESQTFSFQLSHSSGNMVMYSQDLLAGVAICHALNNLPESKVQCSWPRLCNILDENVPCQSKNADSITAIRQVCCLLATSFATVCLPKILSVLDKPFTLDVVRVPLILQTFLHKYQDRCLEIREAARTLFHASMDSIAPDQRTELVEFWVKQSGVLMQSETSNDITKSLANGINGIGQENSLVKRNSIASVDDMSFISDWSTAENLIELVKEPMDVNKLQAMTMAFLGTVGSRYGSYDNQNNLMFSVSVVSPVIVKPTNTSFSNNKVIPGFGIDGYNLARTTCGYLMRLLVSKDDSWPKIRRLSITLLGQGFPVWEPYLEVTTLFNKLLQIVANAEKLLDGWCPGQLLTDEMDVVRSARTALTSIALSRPKVFATVLSIEVLRLQTQTTTGGGIGVGGQGQPLSTGGIKSSSGQQVPAPQPPLLAAKQEVINVIKILCERKTREVHEVFPEIMDVLLACLNKLDLRQYDLQQLFPPIMLFRIASSHTASGKICVGTRSGQMVFYDVKVGKYQTMVGHKAPVTSVTFSPDGKQVASYSMPDNSVCIWQLSSSGLFGMGSSHSVKLVSSLDVPPVSVSHTVSEEDSSLLLWLEWCENKSIHLVTNAGLINKINL